MQTILFYAILLCTERGFAQELLGYLDWPRIHFSGHFSADLSTVNNIRCNFLNKRFTPTNLMMDFPLVSLNNRTGEYYESDNSWNPDGSAQFYFIDSAVTSICMSADQECSTSDPIVGIGVHETRTAVYADFDTDWQVASIAYGLEITIDGILVAKFAQSEIQTPTMMAGLYADFHKSKLIEIKWLNEKYKKIFGGAKELSISMSMDLFSHETIKGRVTGTIGPTNSMDPLSVPGYRVLKPDRTEWLSHLNAPFRFNYDKKFVIIDLSLALGSDPSGHYPPESLGKLDLALIIEEEACSSDGGDCSSGELKLLTNNGTISNMLLDQSWHDVYGGVIKVDLSTVPDATLQLAKHSRLALQQRDKPNVPYVTASKEIEYGIRIGIMGKTTYKLNAGEVAGVTLFASSFDEPLVGADLSLRIFQNYQANTECQFGSECSIELATDDKLKIQHGMQSSQIGTDDYGHVQFILIAEELTTYPRGCGLDGQLYPLEVHLNYKSMTYAEGLPPPSAVADHFIGIAASAALVYTNITIPEVPTWMDVKGYIIPCSIYMYIYIKENLDIFSQYYNLYPVMWKNRIVDLGSYEGVKESQQLLEFSMQLDPSDPRHMPITRDLSKSKSLLIQKFFEKGMQFAPDPPISDQVSVEDTRSRLHNLLQRAVTLELSTMPPYITAWLSLKTEQGENLEVAKLLKSVYMEEMYHMALASNVLNAVAGKPDLLLFRNIPSYPTALGFGSIYQLGPNMMVTIKPMSIGLADVFSRIEEPQMEKQREIFEHVAFIAKMLKPEPLENVHSTNPIKTAQKRSKKTTKKKRSMKTTKKGMFMKTTKKDIMDRFIDDYLPRTLPYTELSVASSSHPREIRWEKIQMISQSVLKQLLTTEISSIAAFYGLIALELSLLESTLQLKSEDGNEHHTLFTGVETHQISRPEVFVIKVTDLYTALKAIITITYEGEGGSKCNPYVGADGNMELSHYYRFQEIAKGNKLIKVPRSMEVRADLCLNFYSDCPSQRFDPEKFCYIGDPIPLSSDGVWPIVSSPDIRKYEKDSLVTRLNKRFNTVYTNLLRCLQTTLNGKPERLEICMTMMYNLVIHGKRLVKTKITEGEYAGRNVAPTWSFIRSPLESAGLPLVSGELA